MSIERDQSTRKQMRAGISGENVLPPLDEFSVTETLPELYGWKRIESPLGVIYMRDGFVLNPAQYKDLIEMIERQQVAILVA